MFTFITQNLLWTEGWFVLPIVIVCLFGTFMWRPVGYIGIGFFLFSFYFFRNPERMCIEAVNNPHIIVCPSDGKVIDIQQFESDSDGFTQKVSIFLSPLDVHVNWVPFASMVQKIEYHPGIFAMAFLPKSSELNERNDVVFINGDHKVKVRQIAGTLARRICCWVSEHESVHLNKKFGMIRFGSRVEVFLPPSTTISVAMNDRVVGGQTVLGSIIT